MKTDPIKIEFSTIYTQQTPFWAKIQQITVKTRTLSQEYYFMLETDGFSGTINLTEKQIKTPELLHSIIQNKIDEMLIYIRG